MKLQEILVATDESEASAQALRTALDVGRRTAGRVTAVRVLSAPATAPVAVAMEGTGALALEEEIPPAERLRKWLDAQVTDPDEVARVQIGIAWGLPSIEICRFAERNRSDLIVVGRKVHAWRERLLLEDTTDAVARRSRAPTLFVPRTGSPLQHILVALDGSERGMVVLREACGFARALGASLRVVTVERPSPEPVGLVVPVPIARTSTLQSQVREVLARESLPDAPVIIRRGNIVEEVLAAVALAKADVLAIGHHLGGPSGFVDPGSTAQHLGHATPCAVLTVPL